MKKIKKYKKLILTILLIYLFFVGKNFYGEYRKANPDWEYQKIKLEKRDLKKSIDVDGEVVADYELNLASEIPGIVSKIYVKEGDFVKNGQLLMRLKDTDFRNQLNSAYLNQKINEVNYEKVESPNQNLEIDNYSVDEEKRMALDDIKNTKNQIESLLEETESYLNNILRQRIDKYFDHTEFDDGIYQPTFTYRIKSEIEISRLEEERKQIGKDFKRYQEKEKTIGDTENILKEFEDMVNSLYQNSYDFLGYSISEKESIASSLVTLKNEIKAKKDSLISLAINLDKLNKKIKLNDFKKKKINNLVNPVDLKLAKERIKSAKVQTHSAYTQLQKTYIRATKSGVVVKIHKDPGEYAGPSQPLIKIYSKNKYILANIPEVDLGKVKRGMEVDIKLDAFRDKIFKGKIVFIYPEKKEVFGIKYYEAKIIFDKNTLSENNIFAGMSVEIKISHEKKKVLNSLGRDEVKKDEEKYFVWTLNKNKKGSFDEKFKKEYFNVGFIGDDFIEVISDLSNFDLVKILENKNERK